MQVANLRSGHTLGTGTPDAQLLDAAERYAGADAALQAALTQCGAKSNASHAACCTLTLLRCAGNADAYLDVLRAAPLLDGRVFVEVFARGHMPATGEDRWLARAAWHAASYINACTAEVDAVRCLLDSGALVAQIVQHVALTAARAGALRLAAQLCSAPCSRDDIAVHAYQLMLVAMRGRAACSAYLRAEVNACLCGQVDGYDRFVSAVRASRDAASRLLGLELLREFCRDKKSGQQAVLADEYYSSAAAMLPTDIKMRGSVSARYLAVFHEDPAETRWSIRQGLTPLLRCRVALTPSGHRRLMLERALKHAPVARRMQMMHGVLSSFEASTRPEEASRACQDASLVRFDACRARPVVLV